MVELAGGLDVLGSNDAPSRETSWKEVEEARPDVVLIMPCGYTIDRTIKELSNHGAVQTEWKRAHARWPQIYVLNAASYFSRPGPRLIDGLEVLADILNPERKQSLDPDKAIQLVPTAFGMASQA
jgi:iron complex transport system substrate-binding protein